MKKIMKITIGLTLLFLCLGAVNADTHPTDIFTAPSPLHPIGNSGFVDEQGHNINIYENTDETHKTWFENDTENGYLVQPYEANDTFYIYADDENDCGILEIIEHDGVEYIINSWTPNGSDDARIIWDNLLEFNEINHLTPIKIDG